jgi:hypothetical protein
MFKDTAILIDHDLIGKHEAVLNVGRFHPDKPGAFSL